MRLRRPAGAPEPGSGSLAAAARCDCCSSADMVAAKSCRVKVLLLLLACLALLPLFAALEPAPSAPDPAGLLFLGGG